MKNYFSVRTLLMFAIFLSIATFSWADDAVYKAIQLGSSSLGSTSVDKDDWKASSNGLTFRFQHWAKTSSKISADFSQNINPSITTSKAIDKPVTKITIKIESISNIESITLYSDSVLTTGAMKVTEGTFAIQSGYQSLKIKNPSPNRYYKLVVKKKSNSNGSFTLSEIDFYSSQFQVSWNVNGSVVKNDSVLWGDNVTFPAVDDDNEYKCIGWTGNPQAESATQPSLVEIVDEKCNVSNDTNFYAVYKRQVDVDNNTYTTVLGAQMNVGTSGFSTLYYSDRALVVPEGTVATTYSLNGNELEVRRKYICGDVIPAGEAVVVFNDNAYQNKEVTPVTLLGGVTDVETDGENILFGTDVQTSLVDDKNYYFLGLSRGSNLKNIGFYFMNQDGSAFENGAHKAYMKIPSSVSGVKSFLLDDTMISSAITNHIVDAPFADVLCNLSGQRVSRVQKGLYIKNGRKFVSK